MKRSVLAFAIVIGISAGAHAECVSVKYRETCVPLDKLECTPTESSFVHQVCYDQKNRYMVILLNTTRYHYCDIPKETVTALVQAESVGRFYNTVVKGKFSCEGQAVPTYSEE